MVDTTKVTKMITTTSSATHDHTVAWLEFWSKIAGAIAWPCAVVILALLFAGPLRRILAKIVQFEGWGAKATFSEDVMTLAAGASQASDEAGDAIANPFGQPTDVNAAEYVDPDRAAQRETLNQLTSAGRALAQHRWGEPRTIILEAWLEIERAINYLYTQTNLPGCLATGKAFDLLRRNGTIPEDLAQKVTDARTIRNKAVHDFEAPSVSDAAIYAQAAKELARQLADRALPP